MDKNAPLDFLLANERGAVFDDAGRFQVSLYKVLLFAHIADGIKAGKLNLLHSHKYRSLDDYLLPQVEWEHKRDEYLKEAALEEFADCEQTLAQLAQHLDHQYRRANRRYHCGDNPLLKLRADGTFHVTTPKEEDTDALSLSRFFPERKYVSLLEALSTVHKATNFLDEFEHWQLKYPKRRPPEKTFFAGIVGYGCDIGQGKIAHLKTDQRKRTGEHRQLVFLITQHPCRQ